MGLEKILEEIERLQDISGWDLQTVQGILEIIRKHMNDDWIPVEKRLPEKYREVIAQFEVRTINAQNEVIKSTYMHVLYLDEHGYWKSIVGIPNGKVIAWQPLPEPYQPEKGE